MNEVQQYFENSNSSIYIDNTIDNSLTTNNSLNANSITWTGSSLYNSNIGTNGLYTTTTTNLNTISSVWTVDKYVEKEPHIHYKHTKISDGDLQEAMDTTMNKMIYEEICKHYDKFIWNDVDNKYTTEIVINDIPLVVSVDYITSYFYVLNNNEIIIKEIFNVGQLVQNIKSILNPISKNDILNKLRGLKDE